MGRVVPQGRLGQGPCRGSAVVRFKGAGSQLPLPAHCTTAPHTQAPPAPSHAARSDARALTHAHTEVRLCIPVEVDLPLPFIPFQHLYNAAVRQQAHTLRVTQSQRKNRQIGVLASCSHSHDAVQAQCVFCMGCRHTHRLQHQSACTWSKHLYSRKAASPSSTDSMAKSCLVAKLPTLQGPGVGAGRREEWLRGEHGGPHGTPCHGSSQQLRRQRNKQ